MLNFNCDNCGKKYSVDDKLAGRKAKCNVIGIVGLVDLMPTLLALLAPLALGSPVLAKAASRDPLTAREWLRSLTATDAELAACADVLDFPSDADACVRARGVVVPAGDGQLGAQGGGVSDRQQVRVLGLDVAVEGLDPGLVGWGAWPAEVLGDRAQRQELSSRPGGHLGSVVGDGEQDRAGVVVFVQVDAVVLVAGVDGLEQALGFEGDEPTNVVKGQWPTADSPLAVDLRSDRTRLGALPAPKPTASVSCGRSS